MTPGAGTAQLTSRVVRRRMRVGCAMRWGVRVDWERRCSKRRCSGRHKCRPYGASVALRRLNVVSRRLFCGVARRGAIHDARCRNGTIDQSRCASAAGAGCALRWGVRVDWGRRYYGRRCSGRHKCRPYGASVALWRLNVVSRRLFCGVARRGAIHDARCRNGTIDQSRCASADAGGLRVEGGVCGLGRAGVPGDGVPGGGVPSDGVPGDTSVAPTVRLLYCGG